GLTPIGISNLMMIFIQWITGWIAVRLACHLSPLVGGTLLDGSRISRAALFLLMAFSPLVGWKITHGHMFLLAGCWPWLVVLSLALGWLRGGLTLTEISLAVFAIYSAFTSTGQQSMVYSAVFGLPITLGLIGLAGRGAKSPVEVLKAATFAISAAIVGMVFALPRLLGMLLHAFGPDAARSASGESVIYAYTTAEWSEWWWKSFFWSLEVVPLQMPEIFWHEVNNPGGPIILMALGFAWYSGSEIRIRKERWLVLASLLISFAMIVAFATNWTPVSTAIATLFSPLRGFRVPQRAMVPFLLALIPISFAWLPRFEGRDRLPLLGIAGAAAFAAYISPAIAREWIGWLAVGSLALAGMGLIPKWNFLTRRAEFVVAALFLMVGSSLASFSERKVPFTDTNKITEEGVRIRKQIMDATPELRSALTRAVSEFEVKVFAANTGWNLGFSGIDGYWFAPKRYLELYLALDGTAFNPTVNFIRAVRGSRPFESLRQLYNVCCAIGMRQNGATVVERIGKTAGPAWFPRGKITAVQSIPELAQNFLALGPNLTDAVASQLFLVRTDPSIPPHLADSIHERCAGAKVEAVDAPIRGQKFGFKVSGVEEQCPLAVATNYVSTLIGGAVLANGERRELTPFPAYGSLTGLIVPAGTREIWLEARVPGRVWAELCFWLAFPGLAFLLVMRIFEIPRPAPARAVAPEKNHRKSNRQSKG
ncbi:MAG: hypothetical protein AAB425_04025, partial [Bdellovibrionota bacterium]